MTPSHVLPLPPLLPDWISGTANRVPGALDGDRFEARFDQPIADAGGRDVAFDLDPSETRISAESTRNRRTSYDAITEVTVSVPGTSSGPIPVSYRADLPQDAATPPAMRALNPFDPSTWPQGATIELDGADYAGTPFEAAFRELATANDLDSVEDVRLVLGLDREGEVRVMSGAARLFDAPAAHGPASQPRDRHDWTMHTLMLRDPHASGEREALADLFVTGSLPDGSVGQRETVAADGVEALVTDVDSGEVNEVDWRFDAQGRPVAAEATLTWEPGSSGRDSDRIEADAQAGFREDNDLKGSGDHVGHILAYRFVNGHGPVNMFPQDGHLNTGPYVSMENEWADWLAHGMELRIEIRLSPDNARRPDQVVVDYEVIDPADGDVVYDPRVVVFDNRAGETFDRVARNDMDEMIEQVAA